MISWATKRQFCYRTKAKDVFQQLYDATERSRLGKKRRLFEFIAEVERLMEDRMDVSETEDPEAEAEGSRSAPPSPHSSMKGSSQLSAETSVTSQHAGGLWRRAQSRWWWKPTAGICICLPPYHFPAVCRPSSAGVESDPSALQMQPLDLQSNRELKLNSEMHIEKKTWLGNF